WALREVAIASNCMEDRPARAGRRLTAKKKGPAASCREASFETALCADHAPADQRAEDEQQDERTDEGDHDLRQQATHSDTQSSDQPTAEKRAENTDHDVPDAAHAPPGH